MLWPGQLSPSHSHTDLRNWEVLHHNSANSQFSFLNFQFIFRHLQKNTWSYKEPTLFYKPSHSIDLDLRKSIVIQSTPIYWPPDLLQISKPLCLSARPTCNIAIHQKIVIRQLHFTIHPGWIRVDFSLKLDLSLSFSLPIKVHLRCRPAVSLE